MLHPRFLWWKQPMNNLHLHCHVHFAVSSFFGSHNCSVQSLYPALCSYFFSPSWCFAVFPGRCHKWRRAAEMHRGFEGKPQAVELPHRKRSPHTCLGGGWSIEQGCLRVLTMCFSACHDVVWIQMHDIYCNISWLRMVRTFPTFRVEATLTATNPWPNRWQDLPWAWAAHLCAYFVFHTAFRWPGFQVRIRSGFQKQADHIFVASEGSIV